MVFKKEISAKILILYHWWIQTNEKVAESVLPYCRATNTLCNIDIVQSQYY